MDGNGIFCLVIPILLIVAWISYIEEQQAARDTAARVTRDIRHIGGGAQQDMDTLTEQFRDHVDQQTKRYRK
jgi:hypothetical protein